MLGLNRHPCSLIENETEESESDEEMFDHENEYSKKLYFYKMIC